MRLRVGIVGHGFMARAHTQAWRLAPQAFSLPVGAEVAALAGRDRDRTKEAAAALGIPASTDDWRELIADSSIGVVDICTPVDSHAEIAIPALANGKHVLCEKPMGLDLAAAEAMARAADDAAARGVIAMVGFNYRRVPALGLARRLCRDGTIGHPRHVRARYLQDWLADANAPWSWRLDAAQAGAGALADLGSHLIDLVHFVLGSPLEQVSGQALTFVGERPDASGTLRPVTVDDACTFAGRNGAGMLATFEVSRLAHGRKNQLALEIDGDRGSLAFDLERLNELMVHTPDHGDDLNGFRRILVTELAHPYLGAWWPPGHVLGWDHTFVHQARDFLEAVRERRPVHPTFADGAYVQAVIDAVQVSAREGGWRPVDETDLPAAA
jgi:predicted dehydrogenase